VSEPFVKQRQPAVPGSIPDVLQMFVNEVRFYREVAPVVGVRVPGCFSAEEDRGATRLVLEDLSEWAPGADPSKAARALHALHIRWEGDVGSRWSWLRPPASAADLVGEMFDATWPSVEDRTECTSTVRSLGARLVGRVPEADQMAARAGPETLVHGDASLRNMRTSPSGEVALLDWEDVGVGPGVYDLAWLLVSSVDPDQWTDTIAAYGETAGLNDALPSATVQGFLSLADAPVGSHEELAWIQRIDEAARRIT
jgi:phosphotransferase family enzyme